MAKGEKEEKKMNREEDEERTRCRWREKTPGLDKMQMQMQMQMVGLAATKRPGTAQHRRRVPPRSGRSRSVSCWQPLVRALVGTCSTRTGQDRQDAAPLSRLLFASKLRFAVRFDCDLMWEGGGGGLLRLLQCGETFLPAIKRVETRTLSYLIQVRSTASAGSVKVPLRD